MIFSLLFSIRFSLFLTFLFLFCFSPTFLFSISSTPLSFFLYPLFYSLTACMYECFNVGPDWRCLPQMIAYLEFWHWLSKGFGIACMSDFLCFFDVHY